MYLKFIECEKDDSSLKLRKKELPCTNDAKVYYCLLRHVYAITVKSVEGC